MLSVSIGHLQYCQNPNIHISIGQQQIQEIAYFIDNQLIYVDSN